MAKRKQPRNQTKVEPENCQTCQGKRFVLDGKPSEWVDSAKVCPTCSRPCFLCNKQSAYPPMYGELVTGRRWHEWHERMIVATGYVCDMHLDEFESYRFLP